MSGWYGNVRMVWKFAIVVTKNTMSIPTIQTHCIELAIFVTKNTMSIPTIGNTMHGIDNFDGMEIGHGMEMWDGMEIGHCMEIYKLRDKKHNVNPNKPNALYSDIQIPDSRIHVASKNCAISGPPT